MNLKVITGDLFDAQEKFICHQCNAVTTRGANLAKAMFARFPWADIYSERSYPHTPAAHELPGNIIVRGDGKDQRFVVNFIGQYYPGSPRYPDSKRDGFKARQKAFTDCLDKVAQIPYLTSVAFPWQIGCGAAGGDWLVYRHLIREFAEKVNVPVRVYRLPNET
jgi:O-acetyl-ADP-ribose deacetylase (regulator of RNase III)